MGSRWCRFSVHAHTAERLRNVYHVYDVCVCAVRFLFSTYAISFRGLTHTVELRVRGEGGERSLRKRRKRQGGGRRKRVRGGLDASLAHPRETWSLSAWSISTLQWDLWRRRCCLPCFSTVSSALTSSQRRPRRSRPQRRLLENSAIQLYLCRNVLASSREEIDR